VPEELAKKYQAEGFGKVWKRNCPAWTDGYYLDPDSSEPTWEKPFAFWILSLWLDKTEPLFKMLAPKVPGGDEEDALILSITRAFDDCRSLHNFVDETWMYDPMIQAEILGEAHVPPDRPLRAIAQERAREFWEAKNSAVEPQPTHKLRVASTPPQPD